MRYWYADYLNKGVLTFYFCSSDSQFLQESYIGIESTL